MNNFLSLYKNFPVPSKVYTKKFKVKLIPISDVRSRFSANSQAMIGHQVSPQRCRLARIAVDWHCMGI